MHDSTSALSATREGTLRFLRGASFGEDVEDYRTCHKTGAGIFLIRPPGPALGLPAVLSGWCAFWRRRDRALAERAARPRRRGLFAFHERGDLARSRDDLRLRRRDCGGLFAHCRAGLDDARYAARRAARGIVASVGSGTHSGLVRAGTHRSDRRLRLPSDRRDCAVAGADHGTQPPQHFPARGSGALWFAERRFSLVGTGA